MPEEQCGGQIQLLSVITKPFVNLIVQLDKDVLECWSTPNCTSADGKSLILEYCGNRKLTTELSQRSLDENGRVLEETLFNRTESRVLEKCERITNL